MPSFSQRELHETLSSKKTILSTAVGIMGHPRRNVRAMVVGADG